MTTQWVKAAFATLAAASLLTAIASAQTQTARITGAANAFLSTLDEKQRKMAIYDAKAPGDILSLDQRDTKPLEKLGIKASDLNGKQYAMLEKLVEEYVGNVPDEMASARRAKFKSAKKDEIYFGSSRLSVIMII